MRHKTKEDIKKERNQYYITSGTKGGGGGKRSICARSSKREQPNNPSLRKSKGKKTSKCPEKSLTYDRPLEGRKIWKQRETLLYINTNRALYQAG